MLLLGICFTWNASGRISLTQDKQTSTLLATLYAPCLAIRSPNFTRTGNHFALPSFPPPLSTVIPLNPAFRSISTLQSSVYRFRMPAVCHWARHMDRGRAALRTEQTKITSFQFIIIHWAIHSLSITHSGSNSDRVLIALKQSPYLVCLVSIPRFVLIAVSHLLLFYLPIY